MNMLWVSEQFTLPLSFFFTIPHMTQSLVARQSRVWECADGASLLIPVSKGNFSKNRYPLWRITKNRYPFLEILPQKHSHFFHNFLGSWKILKNRPSARDFLVQNGTHVSGSAKNQPILAEHPCMS